MIHSAKESLVITKLYELLSLEILIPTSGSIDCDGQGVCALPNRALPECCHMRTIPQALVFCVQNSLHTACS